MATFPSLEPTSRTYDFGRYPVTTQSGWAGGMVRFRHGLSPANHRLTLEYTYITEAQAKLLRDHYREQRGGFFQFALSSTAWAGHSSMTDLVPSTTSWRYAKQPEETHRSGSLVDMIIELEAVF
jgi:hypothetical protein